MFEMKLLQSGKIFHIALWLVMYAIGGLLVCKFFLLQLVSPLLILGIMLVPLTFILVAAFKKKSESKQ
jgi:hypothetical protein